MRRIYKSGIMTIIFSLILSFSSLAALSKINNIKCQSYIPAERTNTAGWRLIEQKWYYFDKNGQMLTGWIQLDGKWYYLSITGECAIDTVTPDGYTVGSNGAWIPDLERIFNVSLEANQISSISIYESPVPAYATKKIITSAEDINLVLDALNKLEISESPALGFAPGGLMYIRINKFDGSICTFLYGDKAIRYWEGTDSTIYSITDSRDFYQMFVSLASTKYAVDRDEMDNLLND